jgi:hypothetical protein
MLSGGNIAAGGITDTTLIQIGGHLFLQPQENTTENKVSIYYLEPMPPWTAQTTTKCSGRRVFVLVSVNALYYCCFLVNLVST